MDGYEGYIVMIVDLKDPARPQEVSRWWLPGQWVAGGENPYWCLSVTNAIIRCALAIGSTSVTALAGLVILDMGDMVERPESHWAL